MVATTAVAHAPPIPASHGKIPVTAAAMVRLNHAASAAHKPHARYARSTRANRVTTCNGKTHAAPVLTSARTNATISTNASPPAMCLRAFHHQACQRAAAVVAEVAIVAVVAAAAHAQVVAVGATPVAGFGADLHIHLR